jgi:predicted ATPase/class 3 adenylate cyclase
VRNNVRVTRLTPSLPTGVVTFLLTDVEGSTQAWQASPAEMTGRVSRHYEILDAIIAEHGGARPQEQGEGDSVVAAFGDAAAAVTAAIEAQVALRAAVPELPVRMALHTGEATLRNEDNYVGLTIIRCARIRSCGHGGQILLSSDTADALGTAGTAPGLLDLGLYGLKGLDGRERIWQVVDPRLPTDFPPLNAGASSSGNLPAPISTFVGRRHELAALGESLAAHRLVTVVGEGGIGKSRLAAAAAAATADSMPGGVWWIPLSEVPADDTDAVAAWMLRSCSLPRPSVEPIDALIDHFGSVARSLVVVDGVDRAHAAATTVIGRLLSQCADTQVLATGTEPLHVPGEVVQQLAAMTMPDDDVTELRALFAHDATRLFIERATAASRREFDDGDATHIVDVCRTLHGAPLAIELAAARVGSTPLAELAESLGALVDADGPVDLTRTLASSIEWTYQLLDVGAQTALRRLGVFRGDIEIDAATAVIRGPGLDDRAAAIAIRRLLDQQLLTVDRASGRAGMSAPVRKFAHDLLRESDDAAAVTMRHGAWFAAVAERFGAEPGTDEALPMSLLAPDEADVLAALDASMGSEPPTIAYRILVALGATWSSIGHPEVGQRVAHWLSTRSPGDGEEMWAAAVARACAERSDDPTSPIHRFADEALAIAELVGDVVSPRYLAGAAPSVVGDMAERP